jgi:hypothetical protein
MMTPRAASHAAAAGFGGLAITASDLHWAWIIALCALAISLGFALLRFVPKIER